MRRFLSIVLVVLFSITAVFASWSAAESSGRQGKLFLWKARSATNCVYILGSIHLVRPSLYPLAEEIERSFELSDILVVEVNLEQFDPQLVAQMFIERGVYSGGSALKDHLSQETFTLTADKLAGLEMDFASVALFKPWFLSITLVTLELLKLGFDPEYGIDKHFVLKAKDSKRILELESLEYQLDLFDGFSDRQQELFLFSTLLDLDIIEKEMDSMICAWENGDTGKLEEILTQGLYAYPEILPIYDKIFYQRNKNMASKIEGFLKGEDTYFVVVGAGHLVGSKGIIQLLKNKGYSVRQL
jgi:hypothetical protein